MFIPTDDTPNHLAFYFWSYGFPLTCSGTWSGSLCMVHIVLQELKAVALQLHKIAFWFSGKAQYSINKPSNKIKRLTLE